MENHPCTLKHSELTDTIIGLFYDVYNELGHGFLESTYAEAMVVVLEAAGLRVVREAPVPVWFRGRKIGQYFADLLVERTGNTGTESGAKFGKST
jgi:GxxExxY protein